jgi:hypothetical protein
VVLFNRSFLSPEPPEHFVKIHGFISLEAAGSRSTPIRFPRIRARMTLFTSRRFVRDPSKPPFKKEYKSELFSDGGFIRLVTEPRARRALLRPKKAEPAPTEDRPAAESPAPPPQPPRKSRGMNFGVPGVK